MKPFLGSDKYRTLVDTYPDPTTLASAIVKGTYLERVAVLRLWFTEGIPFAFKSRPMIYEAMREWTALRLQVDPKFVTLIGSARVGYSTSPTPKYGRVSGEASDLDLSAVGQVCPHPFR
jgi:hypothetical protein